MENQANDDLQRKSRRAPPHRKVSFKNLAQLVSTRWKDLPEEEKCSYRSQAEVELQLYKQAMESYRETKKKEWQAVLRVYIVWPFKY